MSRDTTRPESNSEFIRHDKCNHCPSSDGVAVYGDGHGHCFSCEWTGTYEPPLLQVVGSTKFKKNKNNYTYMKGTNNEVPRTLDFTGPGGETRLRDKRSKHFDDFYIYTDEKGNTEFVVERFYVDETRQEKRFFPNTKWKNKIDNSTRWNKWAMPEPRTIYNLHELSTTKQTTVVVAEGEKAANSYKGKNLLPITTWSGGALSVLKNNWDPLLDFQTIILTPDNDDEGYLAMHKLAYHLVEDLKVSIDNIKIVLYPDEFPKKWDIADPIPENIDTDAHRLVTGALPYTEAIDNFIEIWKSLDSKEVAEVDKDKTERLLKIAEDVFYIGELDEMLNIKTDTLMPLKSFDNNLSYLKIGKSKKKPSTWLLEQEPLIFPRAHSFEFYPKRPRGLNDVKGVPIVNRYKGPSIIGKPGDITMWKDTMEDVFDSAERADAIEQFFAWCFQNQGEKAMWAPLWISPKKGIGKNWITNMLGECYGLQNFKPNLKYKNVTGKFNSWIIGTQFAIINEVFLSKNFNTKQELSEEIKDLITEPYIHIEEKFRRGFDYPNTCNFTLISQHEDCMNIADDERRYFVVKCTDKVRYRDYWKPRWEWKDGDGARFLIHHLKNLEIKDPDLYKERAPVTDDMIELAKRSEHPIFKWLDEHREAETGPFTRNGTGEFKTYNYLMVATDLHRTSHGFKQEGSLEIVIDWLKKRCTSWDPTKQVLTKQITCIDGTRPRAYALPPIEDAAKDYWTKHLRSATNSQLGLQYNMKVKYNPDNGAPTKNKKSHY